MHMRPRGAHVHPSSAYASEGRMCIKECICIQGAHVHPRSAYASEECICIRGVRMHQRVSGAWAGPTCGFRVSEALHWYPA